MVVNVCVSDCAILGVCVRICLFISNLDKVYCEEEGVYICVGWNKGNT